MGAHIFLTSSPADSDAHQRWRTMPGVSNSSSIRHIVGAKYILSGWRSKQVNQIKSTLRKKFVTESKAIK